MRAFQVYINGERVCLAGIGDNGVLTAIVSWVVAPDREEMDLSVGGLISPVKEHVNWTNRHPRVGDEIKIKIIERTSVDKPKSRHRDDPAKDLEDQKKYVRRMAKQFGWKIQMPKPN
jgi:hypothetical protein